MENKITIIKIADHKIYEEFDLTRDMINKYYHINVNECIKLILKNAKSEVEHRSKVKLFNAEKFEEIIYDGFNNKTYYFKS